MWVCTWFATVHRDTGFGVVPLETAREIKIWEFVINRLVVRRRRREAYCQKFERTCPAKGQLGLQNLCVGGTISTLADCGQTAVNTDPTANLPSRAYVHQVVEYRIGSIKARRTKVRACSAVHVQGMVGQLILIKASVVIKGISYGHGNG